MPKIRTLGSVVVLALALAGCAQPASEDESASPTPSASTPVQPSASPEASEDTAAPPPDYGTGVDVSGWQVIEAPSGTASFRIPPNWTVRDESTDDVDRLTVLRDDGQYQVRFATDITGVDIECQVDNSGQLVPFPTQVIEATPVTIPGVEAAPDGTEAAFGAFAQETSPGRVVFAMGLLPLPDAQAPECLTALGIVGPAGTVYFGSEAQVSGAGDASVWVVPSFEDAATYAQTEEYRVIKTVLLSLELQAPQAQ